MMSLPIDLPMSAAQRNAVHILNMYPEGRKQQYIEDILPWFKKTCEVFASVDNDILREILRECDCEAIRYDDIIIQQGEIGSKFYVVLAGKVSVYVSPISTINDGIPADTPAKPTATTAAKAKLTRRMSLESGHKQPVTDTDREKMDRKVFGKFMAAFVEGQCFGEAALIREEHRRTATVISDGPGYVMVLNKDIFDDTLKDLQVKEYGNRRWLIDHHPLFRNWSAKNKKSLELSLFKKTFSFDSVIVQQGQVWEGIMFIINGHAKVQIEPAKHLTQYRHLLPFTDHVDVYQMELNRMTRPRLGGDGSMSSRSEKEQVYVRRKEGYAAAEKRIHKRVIDLCSIETGDMLGDSEAVMELTSYMYTVKAATSLDVYIVSPKNYERLLSKEGPEQGTFEKMKTLVYNKLMSRTETIQGENIPLFKHILNQLSHGDMKPYSRPPMSFNRSTSQLPSEGELFENLLINYMEDKAELVTPRVPGGDYYKSLFRVNASKREQESADVPTNLHKVQKRKKVKIIRPPSAKPRTSTALKKALKDSRELILMGEKRDYIDKYRKNEEQGIKVAKLQHEKLLSGAIAKEDNLMKTITKTVETEPNTFDKTVCYSPTKRPQSTFVTKLNTEDVVDESDRTESAKPDDKIVTEKRPDSAKPDTKIQSVEPLKQVSLVLPSIDNCNGNDTRKPFMLKRQLSFPQLKRSGDLNIPMKSLTSRAPSKSVDYINFMSARTPHLLPHEMTFHKNDKEVERQVLPLLTENPKYRDCDTNELSLSYLEAKVKDFILRQNCKEAIGMLPKLNRFEIKDEMAKQPVRGGKVIVKTSPCRVSTARAKLGHQHTRCQLLPQVKEFQLLQRQRMVRQLSKQQEWAVWLEGGKQ